MQKILLTLIIAFIKTGDAGTGNVISQNNAFLCLTLCFISFWAQLKLQPFVTIELNQLNLKSNFLMIITIFFGLFASICNDFKLELIILIVIFGLNLYFLLFFIKSYIQIKLVVQQNSKFYNAIKKGIGRIWNKGKLISLNKLTFS